MKHGRKIKEAVLVSAIAAGGAACFSFTRFFIPPPVTFREAATWSLYMSVGTFFFTFLVEVFFSPWERGRFVISPWFAWFVAGSIGIFCLGLVAVNEIYEIYGGALAVGAWGLILLGLWSLVQFTKRAKAKHH
jgi:hypothetical protein